MTTDPPSDKPSSRRPSQDVTAFVPAPSAPPQPSPPQHSIPLGAMWGKYRIEAILGKGGGGDVYAAEDTLIKRQVAIKMLPPELAGDPALLARFKAEAQSAGRLNHPNVVTIYEIMEIGGVYAIVMELATGGSMQDYLARKGSPGSRASTRLAGEACKALIVAHEAGLIHRDIKPANLLLTREGHVKVADFGLAKVEAADATMHTQAGAILGTPAFMSPEQCRGDKIDHRTDLYSLGCTYFAMLTGKPPYEAASSMQVMFSHCSAPIPNPCELNADTPPECAEILAKALAKNPSERYANARELFSDIRALLGGATLANTGPTTMMDQPAIVAPPSWEQLSASLPQASARNKWLLPVAAVAALALVAIVLLQIFPLHASPPPAPTVAVNTSTPPQVAPVQVPPLAPVPVPATVAITPPPPASVTPATHPAAPPIAATQVAPVPAQTLPAIPPPVIAVKTPDPPKSWDAPRLAKLPTRITNSLHESLALIKPGKFTMGDESLPDATPHEVTLTQPFYLGVCEVTQAEYAKIMGTDYDQTHGKELPVPFVPWDDAVKFLALLSDQPEEKAAGHVYRLPTEAEWEYACRAGTTTRFSTGKTLEKTQANFGKNPNLANMKPPEGGEGPPEPPQMSQPPQGRPNGGPPGPRGGGGGAARPQPPAQNGQRPDPRAQHPFEPVGGYPANSWGLKDMHGSVWEWCSDFYSPETYKKGPQTDPTGPADGQNHVARGGCWSSTADECASAYRNGNPQPTREHPDFGLRIVCEIPPNP